MLKRTSAILDRRYQERAFKLAMRCGLPFKDVMQNLKRVRLEKGGAHA